MPISARDRNRLIDVINTAFRDIGNSSVTCLASASSSNREGVAWELFMSGHLVSLANGRMKRARQDAVQAGVIFDHEKKPREPGDQGVIYQGENVCVKLLVKQPAHTVDVDELMSYLNAHGVDHVLLEAAQHHATKARRPAHEFRADIVVADQD